MRWASLACSWCVLTLALQAQPAQGPYLSPAQAMLLAYEDCAKLPPGLAKYTRYLWLPNVGDRAHWHAVLNGHCNGLSRRSKLTPLRGLAGGHLLAVNLAWYGWSAETWEQFTETDPTFTAVIVQRIEEVYEADEERVWPGGKDGEGKDFPAGYKYRVKVKKTRVKEEKKVQGFAPWLVQSPGGKTAVDGLASLTSSKCPVVNAYVFLDNTGSAGDGRKPDYYDMLGIKDEKTFHQLLGVDIPASAKFSTDLLAAVGVSGVTQEPRAIQRFDKIGGALWRSLDVGRGKAKGKKNALRVLGSDASGKPVLEFEATEQYGHLPNGLWAFGLFNAKGEKQATAPDTIAGDAQQTTRNSHSVRIGVSCIRCHSNGGLQDIDDWVRNFPPELDLLAGDRTGKKEIDYEEVERLKEQYARKLEPFLKSDRERYEAALVEITGLSSQKYAAAYAQAWAFAADAVVGLDQAARELGCQPERLAAAVRHQVKLGKADPVLAVFALPEKKQKGLPRSAWLEAYGLAQQYLAECPP